jgi:hypothetical protein
MSIRDQYYAIIVISALFSDRCFDVVELFPLYYLSNKNTVKGYNSKNLTKLRTIFGKFSQTMFDIFSKILHNYELQTGVIVLLNYSKLI